MAEALTAAALRDARRPARRSAPRSRSTASTSPCAPGEVCALVGQNGAGKSTLMSDPCRRAAARRGRRCDLTAAPYAPRESARSAPRRRRDDLSGAVARAAPEVMENILLGVEPMRLRPRAIAPRMRDDRGSTRCAELGHDDICSGRAGRRPVGRPRSSWSRLRARSRPAAACSCSTSRPAASGTPTSSACSICIAPAEGAGASRSSTSRTSSKK